MTINDLILSGWSYHDLESERLARELETADVSALDATDHGSCLQLSNHTIGEHLRDWSRARRFAEHVFKVFGEEFELEAGGPHLAVARYMDGAAAEAQQIEIGCLGAARDPISTYLTLKSLLAGAMAGSGQIDEARAILGAVNRMATGGAPRQSDRAMAVTNNNVASELLDQQSLDDDQCEFMEDCATAAFEFWKRCGTWENEERALYLRSLVSNRRKKFKEGLEFATSALDVINTNGVQEVDECFIRLAAATACSGLSDSAQRDEQLASADVLASKWSDESLIAEYQRERASILT